MDANNEKRTPMRYLKEPKPLLVKILTVIVMVVLCCNLPSLLFWPLCLKQDLFRPPNTEVLVSACKKPGSVGVPGGEVLLVGEGLTDKTYLLDLRTGDKRDVPNDPLLTERGVFLSSELILLEGSIEGPGHNNYRPHYILDVTDGQRYQLLNLDRLPRLDSGKFDPKNYAYIQSAEQVYIHHSKNTLIALSSDFRENPNGGIILSGTAIGTDHGKKFEQIMKDLGVDYEIADFSLQYADILSPTGKYVVRNDGIYLSGTNLSIVPHYMGWYFRSWYYDESGVVVQEVGPFLINSPLSGSHYPFPTPILKLRLPVP